MRSFSTESWQIAEAPAAETQKREFEAKATKQSGRACGCKAARQPQRSCGDRFTQHSVYRLLVGK
jgi:hypothetical protein